MTMKVYNDEHLFAMCDRTDFFLSGLMTCAQHMTLHVLPW